MLRTMKTRPVSAASLLRHIVAIVALLIVAGCGGGSCGGGGCSSCSGVTPLTNGFEATNRIENAGSLRLMPSGIKFLQNNLGTLAKGLLGSSSTNGTLTFDIPATSGSASFINYSVCSGGANPTANPPSCVANIDLGDGRAHHHPRRSVRRAHHRDAADPGAGSPHQHHPGQLRRVDLR